MHPTPRLPVALPLQDWSNVRLALAGAYDGPVHPAGQDYSPGDRAATEHGYSAWLIRRGSVRIENPDGSPVTGQAGEWVIPSWHRRRQVFSPAARILSIAYRAHWPDGGPFWDSAATLIYPADTRPRLERAGGRLQRLVHCRFTGMYVLVPLERTTFAVHLDLQQRLHAWVAAFAEAVVAGGWRLTRWDDTDPRVATAVDELNRAPLAARLDEAAIARRVKLSSSQLERLFTARLGITPRRYFERRRRDEAARRLAVPQISVKEVAYQLGFRQISHFSAWFSRTAGAAPREFRRLRTRQLDPGVG